MEARHRQQGPDPDLPGAALEQEERLDGVGGRVALREPERQSHDQAERDGDGRADRAGAAGRDDDQRQEERRPDQVELLLHRRATRSAGTARARPPRPGSRSRWGANRSSRVERGRDGVGTGRLPRAASAPDMTAPIVATMTTVAAGRSRRARRGVEVADVRPAVLGRAPQQHAGDQEARDDEEDVDADEAAREAPQLEVVGHDRNDRDRPQTLDVGAEPRLRPGRAAPPTRGRRTGTGRRPRRGPGGGDVEGRSG